MEKYILGLRKQNVVYSEIMLNGLLSPGQDISIVLDVFRRFRERADWVSEQNIRVEFVVAIARGRVEKVEPQVERIIILYEAGLVCGCALAGEESACSVKSLQRPLARLKETGFAHRRII